MKQICVVGVGYVGLVTGACFADLGNRYLATFGQFGYTADGRPVDEVRKHQRQRYDETREHQVVEQYPPQQAVMGFVGPHGQIPFRGGGSVLWLRRRFAHGRMCLPSGLFSIVPQKTPAAAWWIPPALSAAKSRSA